MVSICRNLNLRSREKKGHPEYGQYLLYLGRISREKGAHEAIAIANRLEMPLIIAGHKELTEASLAYFDSEIEPNLGGNIHYDFPEGAESGRTKNIDAGRELFSDADRWPEPFGMTMVLAMASGTPVVVNNIGSGPEVVEHGVTGYVANSLEDAIFGTKAVLNGQYDPYACRRSAELNFSVMSWQLNTRTCMLKQQSGFQVRVKSQELWYFRRCRD